MSANGPPSVRASSKIGLPAPTPPTPRTAPRPKRTCGPLLSFTRSERDVFRSPAGVRVNDLEVGVALVADVRRRDG